MPDDQNKTSTIDDLVKELSRPQGETRSAGMVKNNNSDPSGPSLNKSTTKQLSSDKPSTVGSTKPAFDQTKSANSGSNTGRYPTSSTSNSAEPPPNLPGIKVENKSTSLPDRPTPPISPKPPVVPTSPKPTFPLPSIPMPRSRASNLPGGAVLPESSRPQPGLTRPPQSIKPPPVSVPPRFLSGSKPEASSKNTISSTGPIQEYKSSIRTMEDDIASLKSGQKPSGVDVPRKVTPEAPKPVIPGAPKPVIPGAPIPEIPSSGPMSSVGLGGTEKTGPLTRLPKPPTFSGKSGSITSLGQAEKTGSLPPPVLQKPIGSPSLDKPFKTPEIQSSITVPSEKKGLNTMLYLLIAGVMIIGGFLYWFLASRTEEPEVVLSPTPTPIVISTPVTMNLTEMFSVEGGTPVNFEITPSKSISRDFKAFVNTLTVATGSFLKINIFQDINGTLIPLNWLDMFDVALTAYPFNLRNNIVDSVTLIYGQAEVFNEDGAIDFSVQNLKKTTFVARVLDMAAVELMMKDWEFTITEDLADYLMIEDASKEESVNFLENIYRGVSIKYKNFPFPDTTIDYTVVESAGQSYLVIAGSREAMFTAIDILLAQ